ncbi:predicted protein [Streptomyces viridosporus ATCC 14672]|uniref:Predicted protein n=1 Tax=Streptomyces viridosporus (strain ATCC 14672 / DSM 40746 / JCM 4963 / KCTC 9882 / NRRL B-12104 / FH 1290) TaxID=566461 RepID=D6A4T7_STRV1|nr:predicted protein [Streptomyces viridosporus ATCC 14672]
MTPHAGGLSRADGVAGDADGARRAHVRQGAGRQYGAILLGHRVGGYDWDVLIGHLRVLCRNQVSKEYWEMTVEHRLSLPSRSLEARVGKAVDAIMDDLADDPDEWWVVGPPPDGDGGRRPAGTYGSEPACTANSLPSASSGASAAPRVSGGA